MTILFSQIITFASAGVTEANQSVDFRQLLFRHGWDWKSRRSRISLQYCL